MRWLKLFRRLLRVIWRLVRWGVLLALMLLGLRQSTLPMSDPFYQLSSVVRDSKFDYAGWEAGAINAKLGQTLAGTHGFFAEDVRSQIVRTYFDDLNYVHQLDNQINTIYTNPNVADPESDSAGLRLERDMLREQLSAQQNMVEAILESQVSALLVDEGFGVMGQIFPPLWMRFTGQTQVLVSSPRDEIKMDIVITVDPIPADQRTAIEDDVFSEYDRSSIIVPIGGMALYPAMIIESGNVPFIVETFAHEWLHHYLTFFPLGYQYMISESGEARIINETTASIFGQEIGRSVLERYYPDLVPPPSTQSSVAPQYGPAAPPDFDYGAEMNETRVTVDELLADGFVEEAEAYMEERRAFFWDNGYRFRRINQAFFAFYGGYQVSGGFSAGGQDPIGPAVQSIRDNSPSIHDWVTTMRTITTRDALLETENVLALSES